MNTEKKYPAICRALHQENKGHGGAVNTGIANASGIYLKVVDSDDWVNRAAYEKILETLSSFHEKGTVLDMLLANYVYEKQGAKHKTVIHYRHAIPKEKIFRWSDVKRFPIGQYILMHSVIYRTALLRECGLKLPEHTFYVDNIYVFKPLPYVKTMYYLDVNFYRYFIGRDDQSVNEANMIKRINQQFYVTKVMIDYLAGFKLDSKPLASIYAALSFYHYVHFFYYRPESGKKEHLKMKKDLWRYLYDQG